MSKAFFFFPVSPKILCYISTLKMYHCFFDRGTIYFKLRSSGLQVPYCNTMWHHNPKDIDLNLHHWHHKSCKMLLG